MDKSKFIEMVTSHILEYLPKEYQDKPRFSISSERIGSVPHGNQFFD